MKKLYLTSLLVLFTLPAMANASDPFATATNYGQIEDIFKTQAKKYLTKTAAWIILKNQYWKKQLTKI